MPQEATMVKTIDAGQEHGGGLAVGAGTGEKMAFHGATPIIQAASALTSVQNATAAAVDLPTSEALANALKASYNALQLDFTVLRTAMINKGIISGP